MTTRWMVVVGIGSALAMGSVGTVRAATGVATTAGEQCRIAQTYRISGVKPYKVIDHTVPTLEEARMEGVVLRVDAQPGLTQEWLQGSFEKIVAAGECGFAADPVGVSVRSDGDGFDVQLKTHSEKAANDLLRRMQQLAG